jgi:hypothetical protein
MTVGQSTVVMITVNNDSEWSDDYSEVMITVSNDYK